MPEPTTSTLILLSGGVTSCGVICANAGTPATSAAVPSAYAHTCAHTMLIFVRSNFIRAPREETTNLWIALRQVSQHYPSDEPSRNELARLLRFGLRFCCKFPNALWEFS